MIGRVATKTQTKTATKKPAPERREPPAPDEAPIRTRMINGIQVPVGTHRFRILRMSTPDAPNLKDNRVACAILYKGERRDSYDLETFTPSWETILALWGSGTYVHQWFGRDGKPRGFSTKRTFDDPRHPMLPAYSKAVPVGADAPTEAERARSPDQDPMAAMVKMVAGTDGKIDVAIALILMGTMQAAEEKRRHDMELQHRRWSEEDRRRASERELEHAHRLEREREIANQERERTAEFFKRQAEAAREATPASVDGDRIDELAESMAELATAVGEGTKRTSDTFDKVLEAVLPIAVQRFLGPGATLPPATNGGAT